MTCFVFFDGPSHFADVFVVFKVDELSVLKCVFDFSAAQKLHDVEGAFGASIFHGGRPMAKRVEADLQD